MRASGGNEDQRKQVVPCIFMLDVVMGWSHAEVQVDKVISNNNTNKLR